MTTESKRQDWIDRLSTTLRQSTSREPNTKSSLSSSKIRIAAATPPATTSTTLFRLRDLPEELQRQCIQFCIPSDWCLRATAPLQTGPLTSNPRYSYRLRHVPAIPSSLFLVDKHMSHQVHDVALRTFTGELHLDSIFRRGSFRTSPEHPTMTTTINDKSDHHHNPNNIDPAEPMDRFRDLITTVHMGYFNYSHGFRGFDLCLLDLLPNLHTVIAHSENRLFNGSLYGWGDSEYLISCISDDALIPYASGLGTYSLPSDNYESFMVIQELWARPSSGGGGGGGIRTLLEMKFNMGFGEMEISFYCVFWVRRDQAPVVLGKYPFRKWLGDSRLRKEVYSRAE